MPQIIVVIAKVEAKQDQLELVKSEALKLIEPTRKEPGCIEYNLQQDSENPEVFIFVERWESKELLSAHLESKHLQHFVKATENSVVSLTINEMLPVA